MGRSLGSNHPIIKEILEEIKKPKKKPWYKQWWMSYIIYPIVTTIITTFIISKFFQVPTRNQLREVTTKHYNIVQNIN